MASDFDMASFQGYRIANTAIMQFVLGELAMRDDAAAERFKAWAQEVVTQYHRSTFKSYGDADGEFVRQQTLHFLDGMLDSVHRQLGGRPPLQDE